MTLTGPRRLKTLAKIEIGLQDNLKIYTVHSEALSGERKEADGRLVRMPDDDIEVVELYLHLPYHNELACASILPSETDSGKEERRGLARLHIFCEKLQDARGKNNVIKALLSSTCKIR